MCRFILCWLFRASLGFAAQIPLVEAPVGGHTAVAIEGEPGMVLALPACPSVAYTGVAWTMQLACGGGEWPRFRITTAAATRRCAIMFDAGAGADADARATCV